MQSHDLKPKTLDKLFLKSNLNECQMTATDTVKQSISQDRKRNIKYIKIIYKINDILYQLQLSLI